MAVKITRTDDIDGTDGAEVIEFSLRKEFFEIDLGEANVAKLEKALEPFKSKARTKRSTTSAASKPKKSSPPAMNADHMNAVRAWGRQQGKKVADKGRVPKDVIDAFEEAHATPAPAVAAVPFSG